MINPTKGVGTAPMADRDTTVGYAKIPAIEPGEGINDQDFVSMSGGTGRVLNPNSKHAALAWELLAFMNSPPRRGMRHGQPVPSRSHRATT